MNELSAYWPLLATYHPTTNPNNNPNLN